MNSFQSQYFPSNMNLTYTSGNIESLGNLAFVLKSEVYVCLTQNIIVRKPVLYFVLLFVYVFKLFILLLFLSRLDTIFSVSRGGDALLG